MKKLVQPPITNEYGLYDGSWKGVIVDEAFAHPAKFSRKLIGWIIDHGLRKGYWKPGDLLGDPFGGVGLGGIVAASKGLRWIGVELESKTTGGSPFVELAKQNFELHRRTWEQFGDPYPEIVQGDSREFARIVGEVAGVVTSPPYAATITIASGVQRQEDGWQASRDLSAGKSKDYGTSPGQIGSLKAGTLDAAITSPPYAESIKGDHRETETAEESRAKRNTPGGPLGKSARFGGYGATEGNIGNLKEGALDAVVTSPPYSGMSPEKGSGGVDIQKQWNTYRNSGGGQTLAQFIATQEKHSRGYGAADGQIGNLKEGKLDGGVTSPPYSDTRESGSDTAARDGLDRCGLRRGGTTRFEYGQSDGQIGNTSNQTYWQAMRQVYKQVYLALKPGAVFCAVLKDYVKSKQRVPLCDDTCTLLTSVGFHVFERTRAWVVQETREPSLFGGEVVKSKSRKSFFRRLAESKGSPPIDWEEVIWCRKLNYEPPEDVS